MVAEKLQNKKFTLYKKIFLFNRSKLIFIISIF